MQETDPGPADPRPAAAEPGRSRPVIAAVVVSASAALVSAVRAGCPEEVELDVLASADELASLAAAPPDVVLLDPVETAPAAVVAALGRRPVLVSVSDLEIPDDEVGVDARLPLRRLTRADVRQAIRQLELCRRGDTP